MKQYPKTHKGKINTLEQMRTASNLPLKGKKSVVVQGKGSELKGEKTAKGRATRKLVTSKRSLGLIDVANKKADTKAVDEFWAAFYCQAKIITANGKQYCKYCKSRICSVCNNIREAIFYNSYKPIFEKWEDPYYVVLTVKAVPHWKLKHRIDDMYRAFKLIIQKYQKRAKRGKGIKLIGFKTLECEFNDTYWTYNPHFNILVPNKETGEILKAEWLKLWGKRYTTEEHQYCEPVHSKEKILLEVIKYCTKVFTDPDKDKSMKNRPSPKMYLAAQYNIYKAMKGHRIFERFGFNLPKTEKQQGGIETVVSNYINWKYEIKHFDWVGEDTAGTLTNYSPDARLLHILEHCIDLTLE